MAVKIVYRILRKISDWALEGFYSEVSVEGSGNVPSGGPLLLTPSHHNEIMDIATLSVTVPHRRPIAYWAKASMFANPLSRQIMLSAGALPVDRTKKKPEADTSPVPAGGMELHRSTLECLASEQAIAIFPEGTSYTEPRIVQVKEGAARAALEFARWRRETGPDKDISEKIVVVPVGIVYTDKSKYRSRVAVEYGDAIVVDDFIRQFCSSDAEESRGAVRRLCARIEEHMRWLTVDAPDWSSLYAARMALDMFCPEEKQVPLRIFRQISQDFVDVFSGVQIPEDVKNSLLKYHALLHHAGISHTDLSVIPITSEEPIPSWRPIVASIIWQLFHALLRFLPFVPAFLAYVPAYILAPVAARQFAPKYVEARAQFKVIFGGVGVGAGCGIVGWVAWRWIKGTLSTSLGLETHFKNTGFAQDALVIFGLARALCWWHNQHIDANLKIYRRLRASMIVLRGLLGPSTSDVGSDNLAPYLTMPLPAFNPYVKASSITEEDRRNEVKAPKVASSRLIRHVLRARRDAIDKLRTVEEKFKPCFT